MTDIKVTPLGAGQDVGRSCILVTVGGKNIMLDCGMHMGFNDERRFPDFTYITREGTLTEHLDCVIITHFHLDHCGALPYMSEMVGFDGPIYMTHPTKAICPILLEDYRKITVERRGETNFFTSEMIKSCMKKVIAVNLHQTVHVDLDLEIKAYYAGHVLGAAMFYVKSGQQSLVYTVLIPVFALGRAQELCILLETYWDRMNLKVPIYFSLGLTEKASNSYFISFSVLHNANHYYKLFITWTSQKIKKTFVQRNMFEFKHIKPFDRAFIDNPGAMVVFATPGMLHAGLSLQIFRKWASNENNMLIMPGYCVAGTVGHKVLSGVKRLEFEKQVKIQQEFGIDCFKPANGETTVIRTIHNVPLDISVNLLKREASLSGLSVPDPKRLRILNGALVIKANKSQLVDPAQAMRELGLKQHQLRFTSTISLDDDGPISDSADKLYQKIKNKLKDYPIHYSSDGSITIADTVLVKVSGDEETKDIAVSWLHQDEELGSYLLKILESGLEGT
uniref:Uncharacterized protein n=1 Tax=Octopus bimaculoides TaxID=37653 RepID=A0A0L8I6X1_OCTBM